MHLADIFRSEHILIDNLEKDKFMQRIQFLTSEGVIAFDSQNETIRLSNTKASSPVLEMFFKMQQVFVDTYLLVLMMLEQICGKHVIIKQKLIVHELHTSIKTLYSDKLLPHLQSCLDELIWTSIIRFEEMEYVKINAYANKQGSKTNFLMSNIESMEKLN